MDETKIPRLIYAAMRDWKKTEAPLGPSLKNY